MQDSHRRIWQDAAKDRFSSFAELNVWLLARCRALWQELRHTEYGDMTIAEMLEYERPSLMPMVAPFDSYVETLGKVSSTCLVVEDRNRYSVPCELVGQTVSIRVYPNRLDFVAHDAVVASHPRGFVRNKPTGRCVRSVASCMLPGFRCIVSWPASSLNRRKWIAA